MKLKIILFTLLAFFSLHIFAQSSPVDMLQKTSDQMLSALNQTKNRNSQTLYNLVEKILLPHVDLNVMSQQILGAYWKNASPAQKAAFTHEFTYFITRTYSTALSSYSNEKVRFTPIRGGVQGNRVQVDSFIDQKNGQSISVNYRLLLSGGQWRVYDFSVEGVSLVSNYRSQFAEILRTKGLDGLITQLKSHNAGVK